MGKLKLLLLSSALLLSGCGPAISIGPRVEEKTTILKGTDEYGNPVVIGVVKENIKVKVQYVRKDDTVGTAKLDIGGWQVSPPPENK